MVGGGNSIFIPSCRKISKFSLTKSIRRLHRFGHQGCFVLQGYGGTGQPFNSFAQFVQGASINIRCLEEHTALTILIDDDKEIDIRICKIFTLYQEFILIGAGHNVLSG